MTPRPPLLPPAYDLPAYRALVRRTPLTFFFWSCSGDPGCDLLAFRDHANQAIREALPIPEPIACPPPSVTVP